MMKDRKGEMRLVGEMVGEMKWLAPAEMSIQGTGRAVK